METKTEEELLTRAREGDREALSELLRRYQPRIYRVGLKMCGHREDAEDVLQETLLTMVKNLDDYRGGSSISTWLYTIARSFCSKKHRRSKFAPPETEMKDASRIEVADSRPSAEEVLDERSLRTKLDQVLGTLDPKYRDVFVLRDIEGLTAPEVSDVLGLSVPAVKTRLHRARAAVRDGLAPFFSIDEQRPRPDASCPDIVALFSRHLEGEISAEMCAEMEAHLGGCPACQGSCDVLKRTLALCKTSPEPEVPEEVKRSVQRAIKGFLGGR